jgi:hypothetical protein
MEKYVIIILFERYSNYGLIYFQKDCLELDLLFLDFPMVLLVLLLVVVHLMVLLELLMEERLDLVFLLFIMLKSFKI